jgi:hypothetical protein
MKQPILLIIFGLFSILQTQAQTQDSISPNKVDRIGEVVIKQNRLKEKLKESP